ncbi:MAG: VWA domain-containing protein [Azospirillaceae bacterium]
MAKDRTPIRRDGTEQREVDAFLQKVRATPARAPTGKRGRLIFALDATASREPTWDRACHLQAEMFEATAEIGGLDVQLVFYRGFRECKASPWVADSRALRDRMTAVHCLGGQTQIGRVLKHALNETRKAKVDAVVFVGDCFEEDVDRVCATAGELGLAGVPVFLFHEGGEPVARRAFEQIARLTGGAYCPFDSASARHLKDLLGAVAVFAAGGYKALSDYGARTGGDAVARLTHQVSGREGGSARGGRGRSGS